MRRAFLAALLIVALLAVLVGALLLGGSGPAPAVGDGQVRVEQLDTAGYPEVALYVSVRDEADQLRGGLQRDDFAITEDGVPVDLSGFVGGGAGGPISALLVIDRSGSMEDDAKIDGARAAASAFVDQLRPGDQAAMLAFNDEVDVAARFTTDADELRDEIARLRPDGGTAVYDAVVAGVDLLRDQPGRRALLVLTDGQDCSAPFDGCPDDAGSRSSLDEAIAYAAQAGQPVYLIGLGDRGSDGIDEDVLTQIADETGGRYFYAPAADQLAGLYADLAGSLQEEYRLTYVSPRPFYDGTRRDIQVTVGGATAGTIYTERHLINVVSSPLVGLVLLAPLAGLLFLPAVLRRRRAQAARGRQPAAGLAQPGGPVAEGRQLESGQLLTPPAPVAPALVASAALIAPVAPGPVTQVAAPPATAVQRCVSCGAGLRPGARFCSRCGSAQPLLPAPAVERRAFCDMCGRPLAPGAQSCAACGESVARRH